MGLPILHAVEGESADIICAAKAGVLVEPENSHGIASQIIALSQNRERLGKMAENSKAARGHYDRTQLAEYMLNVLERVSGCRE